MNLTSFFNLLNYKNLIQLPSDPLLDLSLLFPSFFLLFPEVSELVDLLLALSFKEMFRLTGCEVDPWVAPSCSSSRSNKICINPLSPNSDQHLISPHNITDLSNVQVTRMNEMITKDGMS